jgi:hypothetical protein
MSYDIALYRRDFLKRAIEQKLGDWTGADPISEGATRALVASAEAAGFIRNPTNEAFAEFAKQNGVPPCVEFNLDTPTRRAQLMVFPGQLAFSIPYGPRAKASVGFCIQIAKRVAIDQALGFHDPQIGEAIYE